MYMVQQSASRLLGCDYLMIMCPLQRHLIALLQKQSLLRGINCIVVDRKK